MHAPTRFWLLFALQVVCAKAILWAGFPIYRLLEERRKDQATPAELAVVVAAVVVMQGAYWVARRMQPGLAFPHRPVLGHVLLCVGELSFLFPATLAAVAFFDNSVALGDAGRVGLLAAALFAMFCYKCQLQSVGDALAKGRAGG